MEFKIAPEGINLRDIDIWEDLYDAMERGKNIEGIIVGVLRPLKFKEQAIENDTQDDKNKIVGWELSFENKPGIMGVCGVENTGLPAGAPLNVFVKQKITCKITRVEKKKATVLCSRKEAVEENLNKLIHRLTQGEEINTVIRAITNNLFVDIGGGVILKIEQEKARQSAGVPLGVQYREGEILRVYVTVLDKDNKHIEVEPVDPWKEQSYFRGEVIAGQVVEIRDNLAFVRVKPGIIGRVYYKKTDNYSVGDFIKLQVDVYQPDTRRFKLTTYNRERVQDRRRNKAKKRSRRMKQGIEPGNKINTLGGFDGNNSKEKQDGDLDENSNSGSVADNA